MIDALNGTPQSPIKLDGGIIAPANIFGLSRHVGSMQLFWELGDLELQTIQRVLEAAGGNVSAASKRLGISRNTIYRKLRGKQASRD